MDRLTRDKVIHDYTSDELEEMSEKEFRKINRCGDFGCFECYGDHLSY